MDCLAIAFFFLVLGSCLFFLVCFFFLVLAICYKILILPQTTYNLRFEIRIHENMMTTYFVYYVNKTKIFLTTENMSFGIEVS